MQDLTPTRALFVVKATIAPEREAAFNEWYNTRRAAEAESEEALRAFAASDTLLAMTRDYEARFSGLGTRARFAYKQIFP